MILRVGPKSNWRDPPSLFPNGKLWGSVTVPGFAISDTVRNAAPNSLLTLGVPQPSPDSVPISLGRVYRSLPDSQIPEAGFEPNAFGYEAEACTTRLPRLKKKSLFHPLGSCIPSLLIYSDRGTFFF